MSNKTKIIITVIMVVVLISGIIIAISINKKNDERMRQKQGELSDFEQYMNQMYDNKENNISGDNELEENTIENNTVINEEIPNETQNNNSNNNPDNNQSTVIGKEEQESSKENNEEDNRQKAIKLAQEEWGISISSYDFQADLKSDGTYEVTVRSNDANRTTVAIYNVNVVTGEVRE